MRIKRHFCLLMLVVLAACTLPAPVMPPAPAADFLLKRLAEEGGRWQQLDTAAEVGIHSDGRYFSTRQFMLLEKPDRMRVDVLSFFGQLLLQLTVDRGELQVLLNTSVPGQFYQGPASDEVLARFTRLPLRATELVRILLYDPPRLEQQTASVSQTADRYLLRLRDGDQEQQFFFDARLELRRCLYLNRGETLLIVDYDKQDESDGFPRRIQLEMPLQQTRVSLVLSELKLNQPAKTGRFELKPPVDAVPLVFPGMNPVEEPS